jgi:hypothetical protein
LKSNLDYCYIHVSFLLANVKTPKLSLTVDVSHPSFDMKMKHSAEDRFIYKIAISLVSNVCISFSLRAKSNQTDAKLLTSEIAIL